MDYKQYLGTFQKAAGQLDKKALQKNQIEVAAGEISDYVFIKLYKKSWANPSKDPLASESRIFFTIWTNDSSIEDQKILYNLHAFKLRHLKGYTIQSRQFAAIFRDSFQQFEKKRLVKS